MKKHLILSIASLFIVFILINTVNGQKRDDAPAHNLPFQKKLQFANSLFGAGSFYNAITFFEELKAEQPNNPYLMYALGEAYWNTRNYPMAALNYKEAYFTARKEYPDARYKLALMLKQSGNYDDAEKYFIDFINDKEIRNKKLKKIAQKEIDGMNLARESYKNPSSFYVKNAGPNINKAYTEFSPIPIGDSLLLYSSIAKDHEIVLSENKRGDYMAKFYISNKKKYTDTRDSFMVPTEYYNGVFSDDRFHVGNGSLSPGGDIFYFTKCREADSFAMKCKIYGSNFVNGLWSKPYELPIEVNEPNCSNTHPYACKVGKKDYLFFVSNRPKQSIGGYDIYVSTIDKKGKIGKPRNLGKRVNTPLNDITPYYDTAQHRLFYASEGMPSFGGFDVFEAIGGPTRFDTVRNMGFPVNSPADDMYYASDKNGSGNAWMVSNRMGSVALHSPTCCDDIWRVWVAPEFFVEGNVYDAATKQKIEKVAIGLANQDASISENQNSNSGYYKFQIPLSNQFALTANKEGYEPSTEYVSTLDKKISDKGMTFKKDFYLSKIPEDIMVNIVYFDYDESNLRPKSNEYIDKMVETMKKFPFIQVDINAYTDERGTTPYNKELSQKRANAVLNYMVERGISRDRLHAFGNGETNPLKTTKAVGDKMTAMQWNRRTEFRVNGETPGARVLYQENSPEYIDKRTKRNQALEVKNEGAGTDDLPADDTSKEETIQN